MRVINKDEYALQQEKLIKEILDGAVFIYPTDTLYGIGCDATNAKAVQRIRSLKSRAHGPFSVIAPSKDWIRSHCVVPKQGEEWLEKLPGPYTLILKLTAKGVVAADVAPERDDVGVRIPAHWIADLAAIIGRPIVTTSANVTGQQPMYSLDDLQPTFRDGVDFIVYEGEKHGTPSTLVNLTGAAPEVKERKK